MAYIEWNDKYSVGISYIDEQHKTLIFLINDFYEQVLNNNNPDIQSVKKWVNKLKEYAFYHFISEEKQMAQMNYEYFKDHKLMHESFTSKINDWSTKLDEGKMLIKLEVTNYLKNWLINHICEEDKKYSKLFIDSGLK